VTFLRTVRNRIKTELVQKKLINKHFEKKIIDVFWDRNDITIVKLNLQ
jgi:hypothetical protein